jgi:hypothetical protein
MERAQNTVDLFHSHSPAPHIEVVGFEQNPEWGKESECELEL